MSSNKKRQVDKHIMENRKYLKAVVENLLCTLCQGIAQQGHSERERSSNRSNFRELLHVTANSGQEASNHNNIQNDIFTVMADMI